MWDISIQVIGHGGPRDTCKRMWAIAIALGCPPEPDGQTLLLCHRSWQYQARADWKPPPSWVSFIVPKRMHCRLLGKKIGQQCDPAMNPVSHSYEPPHRKCCLLQQRHDCHVVTNHFLAGMEAHSAGEDLHLVL